MRYTLWTNIRLSFKKLIRVKRSSLFSPNVGDKDKTLNNLDVKSSVVCNNTNEMMAIGKGLKLLEIVTILQISLCNML